MNATRSLVGTASSVLDADANGDMNSDTLKVILDHEEGVLAMNEYPMPGPPECLPSGFPHEGAVINAPGCLLHARSYHANSKRLKDTEGAAEYWRADADYQTERLAELSMRLSNLQRTILDDLPAAPHTVSKTRTQARRQWKTWHRFATRPHALEDTND